MARVILILEDTTGTNDEAGLDVRAIFEPEFPSQSDVQRGRVTPAQTIGMYTVKSLQDMIVQMEGKVEVTTIERDVDVANWLPPVEAKPKSKAKKVAL